jgi:RNA polymerase sigma factor (sigma-70 family)
MGTCWDGVHELIARAKAGDDQAWRAFHDMASPFLLENAQRLLKPGWPDESVSDLPQNTWVLVATGIAGFRGGHDDVTTAAAFRAWLRQTMKNVHANQVRDGNAQRRRSPVGTVSLNAADSGDSSDGSAHYEPVSSEPTASTNLIRQERQSKILQVMGYLKDPADRELLRMVFEESCSLRQLAAQRGVEPGALRHQFKLVLQQLRPFLKEHQ